MRSWIAPPDHRLPFLKGGVLDGLRPLPLLHALRPADLGSLVARFPNGVICDGVKPALLPRKPEKVVVNPVFETEGERPVARVWMAVLSLKKSRATLIQDLDH